MGIKKAELGSGKIELVGLIQDARNGDVSSLGFERRRLTLQDGKLVPEVNNDNERCNYQGILKGYMKKGRYINTESKFPPQVLTKSM